MNHKDRMSHPSDPKLTALALNLRKGSESITKKLLINKLINYSVKSDEPKEERKNSVV